MTVTMPLPTIDRFVMPADLSAFRFSRGTPFGGGPGLKILDSQAR